MSKTSAVSRIVRLWDCTESCKSERHAELLFAAISKRHLSDQQIAFYLFKTCRNFAKISDGLGKTALHLSAACGRKELCQWLVSKADSNVNAVDLESNYTPLHSALFCGHFDVAVKLIELGAKLTLLDREHLSPISLLTFDSFSLCSLKLGHTEAYVFGTNLNYTLGVGTDDSKKVPEVLEFFRRNSSSIKQVCMEEFHTVFVTSCYQVYVCGHGQGGRLGIGREKPLLIPTQLPTRGEACLQAAIGLNHTLLLLANGGVLSCGSNIHHQLGISPYVEQSATPRYVNINATKAFGTITSICASKYHSVFSTSKAIFACGLNAGQLGGRDNHMDFITVPQQIAAVTKESDSIMHVSTSLGSVSFATVYGDVFTVHQYQCKRIMRCPGIVKLESQGGRLASVVNGVESGEDLKVMWLTKRGSVYVWHEKRGVSRCSIGAGRILSVCDIALRNDTLLLVTKYGEAFSGLLKIKDSGITGEKTVKGAEPQLPCWSSVNIRQISNVHRAITITGDPKGKNITVIQAHPSNPVGFSVTSERPCNLSLHMRNFLEHTSEHDDLHDIVFLVGGVKIAAHKFILASRGWCLKMLKQSTVQVPADIPLIVFKELLNYLYTNECTILQAGKCDDALLETVDPVKKLLEASSFAGIESIQKILHNLRFENGVISWVKMSSLLSNGLQLDRQSFPDMYDVSVVPDDAVELKAHKCVLSARTEYFNNMFMRGWTEAAAGRKIHLQCSSKIAGWILDFLYTDNLPNTLTNDDLDHVIKLLIASDQYLIDDLKDECAIRLSEMLSLKNCTMILQLAATYNEHRLKLSVMEYIAYNLNAVIENRYLELLDDSLLVEFKEFCKEFFAKIYRNRVVCAFFDAPSDEEILSASSEHYGSDSPTEFPLITDDEERPKTSTKKKPLKKTMVVSPPAATFASSMELSAPISDSVDSIFSPSSSIDSSFNTCEFPRLSESFTNKTSASPPKSSYEPRRVYPPKLSQKQRKKLSTEFEEKLALNAEETKPKPTRGWAKIELPPEGPLELSRSPIDKSYEKAQNSSMRLEEIIAIEQQKRSNLRKMTTKSFHLTQMEDAAILGLEEFYNAGSCFDERITVTRVVPVNVAEPTWMPLSRRLPVL